MDSILELIKYMQIIIISGAVARCVFCGMLLTTGADESQMKKRMKHTISFAVLSQIIVSIINLLLTYFTVVAE